MDAIKLIQDVLGTPAGSFAFIVGIMCLGGWLIYYVTKRVTEIRSEHDHLKSDSHKYEQNFDGRFKTVEVHIDEIRKDLSYLKGSLEVFRAGSAPLAKSHSPISLTETGIKVCEELNAESMIAHNWEAIRIDLDEKLTDKNAYDIQQYLLEMAAVEPERLLLPADLNKLKTYAFQKGNSLAYYSVIFGIIVRDKYLQYKEIDVSEIDACDPSKKPQ